MIDIVERLRQRVTGNMLLSLPPQEQKDGLCHAAADTIEALRAENEKLREALKPFADAVLKDEYSWKYDINSDDFYAAAKALGESGDE